MCDPYTPAQSKHTFCMSTFLREKVSKQPQKGGDPPQTPPENHMFCIFLQKVQKVSKNTFRKK